MGVRKAGPTGVAVNGPKIRELRKALGLEIADLAAAANVTARHMAYVETGRKPRVKPTTFRLICKALKLTRTEHAQLLITEDTGEVDSDRVFLPAVA